VRRLEHPNQKGNVMKAYTGQGTRARNLRLPAEADDQLQKDCPLRTGAGQYVGRLIMEAHLRRTLEEQYRKSTTREEWDASGVRVD
jgi:hypothetical protein